MQLEAELIHDLHELDFAHCGGITYTRKVKHVPDPELKRQLDEAIRAEKAELEQTFGAELYAIDRAIFKLRHSVDAEVAKLEQEKAQLVCTQHVADLEAKYAELPVVPIYSYKLKLEVDDTPEVAALLTEVQHKAKTECGHALPKNACDVIRANPDRDMAMRIVQEHINWWLNHG